VAAAAAAIVWAALSRKDTTCAVRPGERDAATRPVGCAALDDADAAARVDRTAREPRPGNRAPNRRRPTPAELDRFRAANDFVPPEYAARVTGAYTGSTDDVIEWAAWKWGIDEDLLRAQAQHESDWRMGARGDDGESIGIMQIKRTVHRGTFPLSGESTAFNLDYYGAVFRYYYDGKATWLGREERGRPYTPGDQWGSLGAHYAGRWHTAAAESYIADVRRLLAARRWGL
jgi:soluble lytic murein transglycosylase-like protein